MCPICNVVQNLNKKNKICIYCYFLLTCLLAHWAYLVRHLDLIGRGARVITQCVVKIAV